LISKLHYITQTGPNGESHAEMARQACEAGIRWVQLRMKDISDHEMFEMARQTKMICEEYGARFIINDHVELAKEIDADGVHIGQNDMDVSNARTLLGQNKVIGGTANTFDQVVEHIRHGVNYVGVGPFRFTSSKNELSPILGAEGYRNLIDKVDPAIAVPVIAIGGITPTDVPALIRTGVHGIAVASIINNASDKREAVDSLRRGLS